jgi:hypothetical protein
MRREGSFCPNTAFKRAASHDGNHSQPVSRIPAKKKNATKQAVSPTLASVKKEMSQPHFAKSKRN